MFCRRMVGIEHDIGRLLLRALGSPSVAYPLERGRSYRALELMPRRDLHTAVSHVNVLEGRSQSLNGLRASKVPIWPR